MPLNDTKLRKIAGKPYDGPLEMPDSGGLSVRISPKGVITFQLRYRIDGNLKRLKIGRYGDISLRDARDTAEEYRKLVAEGRDPGVAKMMQLNETITSPTVKVLVDEWLSSSAAMLLVKHAYWKRALNRHVTTHVGKMVADEMKISHWEPVFIRIRNNDAPVMASGVLVKMKQIISYAMRRGRVAPLGICWWSEVERLGDAPGNRAGSVRVGCEMTARAWVIIAIELLLSALMVYVLMGQVSAEKKRADAAELLATQRQQTIDDMQVRQRDVAALDAKYTGELADAKARLDDLQHCVRSDKCGLRFKATCPKDNATGTASVDDAASPRLTDSAERDYFTLRDRIEVAGKQITGLQQYIVEQCLK